MPRKRRIAAYVGLGIAAGVLLGVLVVLVLTRTEFGVERVGRYTVRWLDDRVRGELRVQRATSRGGLLGGVTLHGITIVDPDGRSFLEADSARLSYDWRGFVTGRIVFDGIALYDATVLIERLPGDTLWNFEEVFAGTEPVRPSSPARDRLILVGGISIYSGHVVVRTPWDPDPGEPDADTSRIMLRQAPGGTVREMRFEDVDARLPRILWESPFEEGRMFQVAGLSTRGFIWNTPFLLRDMRGTLTLRDSLLTFDVPRLVFPESQLASYGALVLAEEWRFDVFLEGDRVSLVDMQWLLPDLPERGTGAFELRIQSRPDGGTLWYATNLDVRAPRTRILGTLGIVIGGDSTYFTEVALRAAPLDVELLRDFIPGDLPLEGLQVGALEIESPPR
ncbi:MAG: hypothetical protein ACRELD_14790 [Longimicrobiales bacterium]